MRRMHKKQRSGSVCFGSSGEMARAGHWAAHWPQAVQVSDTAGTAREMERSATSAAEATTRKPWAVTQSFSSSRASSKARLT